MQVCTVYHMHMDWDKLRIFQAVAAAGSFTHAGDKLGLSQSAISRQISALEDSLGVSLFHRHARGLILTEQGEILNKTTHDVFTKLSLVESQLLDSKQKASGPLLITIAEFLGTTWLAPLLPRFTAAHPDIQLTILHDDKLLNLGMREADAAIRLYRPEQPDLVQKPLFTMQFHLCAAESYLVRSGRPEDMKDLKNHTLIGYPVSSASPYATPNWHFAAAGLDPETHPRRLLINSVLGISEAAKNGLGIAALPDYLIKRTPGLIPLLPEALAQPLTAYFVYPHEHRHSKRVGLFRDHLINALQDNGG
ncbi:MAG: LysR family transcriptional regulator [Pseudomonadota bacterium]